MTSLIRIAAILFLASCCTMQPTASPLADQCGPPPLAPGYSVTYGSDGTASLPAATMRALEVWHGQVDVWIDCAEANR